MMKKHAVILTLVLIVVTSCGKSESPVPSEVPAGGPAARLAIAGNYLYVASTNQQLMVYDIHDPARAVLTSRQKMDVDVGAVFGNRSTLFAGGLLGFNVYNLTDQPASPVKKGLINSLKSCNQIVVNDSVAFASPGGGGYGEGCNDSITGGLYGYDISGLPDLRKIFFIPGNFYPGALGLQDSILFICSDTSLIVMNVKDPYHPVSIDTLTTREGVYIRAVPDGDVLVCSTGNAILLYDIADIHAIRFKGELKYR